MRILHVTSSLDPVGGGVPVGLTELALSQRAIGLDVELISTWVSTPGTQIVEKLRSNGIKATLVKAREPRSWNLGISKLLRQRMGESDILHIHGMWEHIQYSAGRVARKLHFPYVISPHGMIAPWNMQYSGWSKRLYLKFLLDQNLTGASAIHYTTTIERQQTGIIPDSGVTIIEPTGISLSEFQTLPPKGQFRAAHPEIGDRRIILYLGRLSRQKGLDLLIPAFARAKLENTVLVFVGPDERDYQAYLESLIAQHGIKDNCLFTGLLRGEARIAAMVDADLFVLTSYQENFGLVVVEAMAAGAPLLISDQVNIYEDVLEAGAGGVVPCDIEKIAVELARWMGDPARLKDAGARGRAFALDRYDSVAIARRWAEHYAKLI